MAQSPTHKFGQIIGDLLEEAMFPILQRFAAEYDLYLDRKVEKTLSERSQMHMAGQKRQVSTTWIM